MKRLMYLIVIAAMSLGAATAQAQTGQINSGSVMLSLSPYLNDLLEANDVTTKPVNYGASGYKVQGGTATAASGIQLVEFAGGLTFKTKGAKIQLQELEVVKAGANLYVSAEVIADGMDEGRYSIFEVVSADPVVVTATNTPKKTTALHYNNVEFTINPEFFTDFMDYAEFDSFDATQVLGTLSLDLVVKK